MNIYREECIQLSEKLDEKSSFGGELWGGGVVDTRSGLG